MTARSYSRGHQIEHVDGRWQYADNGQSVDVVRPCARCRRMPTAEGYDACLGHLDGVTSACCGHGTERKFIKETTSAFVRLCMRRLRPHGGKTCTP
jgi:hypothetical protein